MPLIEVQHPPVSGEPLTALTSSASSGDTSLTVENGNSFAANKFVLIEGFGVSKAEIIQISSSAPTSSTITLNSAISFDHATGVTVQQLQFDQVDIEYSTDFDDNYDENQDNLSSAVSSSTWTNLVTTDITPEGDATVYNDTSTAARSYRTRYLDSNAVVYSDYSDPILNTGYLERQAGAIISKAVKRLNQEIGTDDSALLTEDFLIGGLNDCLWAVQGHRKRWSFNENFDASVSDITAGDNAYLLPSDIDFTSSRRSAFNVRTDDGANMQYIDKREYDRLTRGWTETTLSAELNTGSSTITLTDTSNFDDSGTFTVTTGTTQDEVSYDSNNRSTNTLTLSSSTGVTTTHASGTIVWQGASYGKPRHYTIYENSIYLHPVPSTTYHNRVLEMDYYKKLTTITSLGDLIPFPDPLVAQYYLCMVIAERLRDKEERNFYEKKYQERLALMIRSEHTGQRRRWEPRLRGPYVTGRNPVARGIGNTVNEGR